VEHVQISRCAANVFRMQVAETLGNCCTHQTQG
jgi:hypothetical protein